MGHIGIDVHKRESQICILAESDEVIERRIGTEPERFAAVLGTRPRARIVRRAQLGRDAAARYDHQGRPLASPLAPDSGRRLDPPPPSAPGGGVANLGPAHRRAPGKTGGRGRPRPSPRRHPLCPAARWQHLRAPARSASASSRGRRRPCGHVTEATLPSRCGLMISRRFDGWVSANVDLAAVAGPLRRWRPHPSNPPLRRRAHWARP